MTPDWKEKAAEKRRQQANSIPTQWRLSDVPAGFSNTLEFIRTCDLLTPHELRLTEITDGRQLQTLLLTGNVTCQEVITAFSKRAAIAHQLSNCLTEVFFDAALARAKELDDHFKKTGTPVGPLHGFPISFKDGFDIEGLDTTIGWVGLIGRAAKRNSLHVDLMLGLGAIVYVKTNIPQSLMMSDSYNHVFLQSVNAFNTELISGGSSGGEGALVGARGSLIGIGTDIGGSIRIPAVLQGLYGLSPTIGRVPNDPSGRTQKYVVPPVAGPITSSLSSIELYMETLLASEPWTVDPHLFPIPWRKEIAVLPQRTLKVAFIFDDGIIRPQPPVERAIREIASKMGKAGHNVMEWDVSSHAEGYDIWLKAVLADGGQECRDLCRLVGEPLIEGMLVGRPENILSVNERKALEERKTEYSRAYLKKWTCSGIDALVMPVIPWVGFRPKTWVQSKQIVSYTALWNLLNYASLTIPATAADPVLDRPDVTWTSHIPRNDSDDFNHKQYDLDLVKGMPVGLQVVGGRFGEEKAVAVAKVIESLS